MKTFIFRLTAILLCATVQATEFSPQEGQVAPPEIPWRTEISLNGKWRFQPVPLPNGYRFDRGETPALPPPADDKWEAVPIKIPSPWNVNDWGNGYDAGMGTGRPYAPDSIYFPSYPETWFHVRQAWMERRFTLDKPPVPGQRLLLHFESVAGYCRVLVNGKEVGDHFDKYLPFDLDVTDAVTAGENRLTVGVQDLNLFNDRDSQYTKMSAPYLPGSNTDRLVGIWQDVSLVTVPAVRTESVFVKPWLDRDELELELTLRNDTPTPQTVTAAATVHDWVNEAKQDIMRPIQPAWRLGETRLKVSARTLTVPAKGTATILLQEKVNGALPTWSPDRPTLCAALITLAAGGQTLDTKYERFGWRQFTLQGRDLLLNGKKIQLRGDILHPFGAYAFSTRFVRAWYTMIKDMHGNAVRPHAQIYPRCYLEIADEMGICVLDETAAFGSSIRLNYRPQRFWDRYHAHFKGLVERDRNHPSVFGWSFGNEMFAIFTLNKVNDEDKKRWYDKLIEVGLRGKSYDPTRPWISCDGDGDLFGALPVWSKHYGHNLPPLERDTRGIDKPLMVGENGGTYYARPADFYALGGEAVYRDYAGRNEALAVDIYQNFTEMARTNLAYFSASETAWFGLEPLPFGYTDHTRVTTRKDGIFFNEAADGEWGMQVERMPPYVATLNPGFDPALPLYRPLAMFEAQKAAQDPRGPQPCRWDRKPERPKRPEPPPVTAQGLAACIGDDAFIRTLERCGITVTPEGGRVSAIQAAKLDGPVAEDIRRRLQAGETVIACVADKEDLERVNQLAGLRLTLTDRTATSLLHGVREDSAVASLSIDECYFAEAGEKKEERIIARHGLDGVAEERILLRAADTDWSLFNRRSEAEKTTSLACYEQMVKPAGTVLARYTVEKGTLLVTTINWRPDTIRHRHFLRRLFRNLGVNPRPLQREGKEGPAREHDLLLDGPRD